MNKRDFIQQYKEGLQRRFIDFENERKKVALAYSIRFWILGFACLTLFLSVAIALVKSIPGNPWIGLLFAFLLSLIAVLYSLNYLESYKENTENFQMKMKIRFLNRILNTFGNMTWSVDTSLPLLKAEKIIGQYKNTPFKILETEKDIYLTFKSSKNFEYETIVKSRPKFNFKLDYNLISFICSSIITIIIVALIIKFWNKPEEFLIKYFLHIMQYLVFAIVTGVYSIVSFIRFCRKFKTTKMEDTELSRNFIVYTENEIDARYFLTPTFIERFKNIQTVFGRKNISCSCKNNEICFKIDKPKNLFEVCDVFKPLSDLSAISELYDEIVAIFAIIDYFKLDEKTKL